MMNRIQIRTFAGLALLAACGMCFGEEQKLSDPIIGTADASGNLALHVFSPGAKNPNVARLTTDYGVLMCRGKDGWALFVLGDKAKKTVREFSNYERFIEAQGELPPDSVITIYDRCLMPRFYEFYPVHYELFKKFRRDCGEKGLIIAKDPKLTCTCQEGG
jgi:hypothetical protein